MLDGLNLAILLRKNVRDKLLIFFKKVKEERFIHENRTNESIVDSSVLFSMEVGNKENKYLSIRHFLNKMIKSLMKALDLFL